MDAEMVRPLAWLEESGVVPGESIQFTLPELGLDGPAEILAVEPCPAIEPGRGRVITGTFTTARCQLLEIRLVGLDEVLRPTPPHRIFSLDRGDYVPAEELRAGECLRTQSGRVVMVESIRLQAEPERVYNYEVEGEHHYFVGEYGVLVHNACGEERRYSHLSDKTKVAPGRPFQSQQKVKILEENMRRNNGVLRSDDPRDPWFGQDLLMPPKVKFKPGEFPRVPDNQAQVDHIVPRIGPNGEPLGTNAYSNAQVISFQYNRTLGNRK